MSANSTDQIADPGKTAMQGDPNDAALDLTAGVKDEPAVEPGDAMAWFWAVYDVLSASHRDLPPPPWPRP